MSSSAVGMNCLRVPEDQFVNVWNACYHPGRARSDNPGDMGLRFRPPEIPQKRHSQNGIADKPVAEHQYPGFSFCSQLLPFSSRFRLIREHNRYPVQNRIFQVAWSTEEIQF